MTKDSDVNGNVYIDPTKHDRNNKTDESQDMLNHVEFKVPIAQQKNAADIDPRNYSPCRNT